MRLNQEKIERMFNARGSMAGGGGGGSESIAGLASQVWTEENYVSKAFFNELFVIHKKTTTTVYDGDVVVSTTVDTSGVFSPNEVPSQTESTDAQTGYRTVVETEVDNIEAKKGLWTDYFLSALGLNSSGGGGGSDTLAGLLDVELDSPTANQVLTYYNGKWRNMSAPGVDMNAVWQALGDTTTTQQIAHSHLTTALNGYATQLWVGQQGFLTSADLSGYATQTWVTNNFSTPSTVATQMQTYAKIQNGTITIGDASLTPITSVGGTFWGNSWTNGGTVTGSLTGVVQIDMTGHLVMHSGGTGIYLNSDGTGIDWHNAAGEYVSSLIAFTSAQVQINQDLYISSPKIIRIGDAVLVWDGDNNALKLRHASGANASVNFYATGGVSALGYGSGGGGGVGDVTWELLADNTDTRQIALSHLTGALAGYATTSQLAGYLPLTGGTLTNTIRDLLTLNQNGTNPIGAFIRFNRNNVTDIVIGYANSVGAFIEVYNNGSYANPATLYISLTDIKYKGYTIWHAGNFTPSNYLPLSAGSSYPLTGQLVSNVATGTAPLAVSSSTLVSNLNADMVDGFNADMLLRDPWDAAGGIYDSYHTFYVFNITTEVGLGFRKKDNGKMLYIGRYDEYAYIVGTGTARFKFYDNGNMLVPNNLQANGFVKDSSSDSYVLTGGGGHALISGLSVSYAADADLLDGQHGSYYATASSVTTLEGYFTNGSASTAIKLQTARLIWGQSFDGSANIETSAVATMPFVFFINYNNNNNAGFVGRGYSDKNTILLCAYSGNDVSIGANNRTDDLYINTDGNVGIGTTSPSYKLSVNGDVSATNFRGTLIGNAISATKLETARTIWGQSFDGTSNVNEMIRVLIATDSIGTNVVAKFLQYTASPFGLIVSTRGSDGCLLLQSQRESNSSETLNLSINANGGNVGIGTSYPSSTLHVNGTLHASSNIYTSGNLFMHNASTGIYLASDGASIRWHDASNSYVSSLLSFTYAQVQCDQDLYIPSTRILRIGDAVLLWDSGNNALKLQNANGVAANFYTTGGVSALGISGAADGTVNASLIPSATGTYTLGNTSYRWKELYLASTNGSYNGKIYVDYDGINLDSANGGWFGGSRYMIEGRLVIGTQTDDQPNYDLYVAGNTYVDGTNAYFYGNVSVQSLTQRSDMRIKDVISDMTLKISTIAQAPLFRYKLKQGDGTIMVGSSAQYWDALLPEVIHRDADGILGLDYGVTALASVISVAKEVTEHERRIARLEAENAILRAQIEDLKAA